MGKGDKRGKKAKKAQTEFEAAVALGPIEPRPRSGQASPAYRADPDPDPQHIQLEARARRMGKNPEQLEGMRAQALGEDAGRAIYLAHKEDDAAQLWGVYARLTSAEARYHRLKLGISANAKCAKIETEPERIETRAEESPPDDRTWEEKLRSATNRWMEWQGHMGRLSAQDQTAIWDIARGRRHAVKDGKITLRGRAFLAALEKLAEMVER